MTVADRYFEVDELGYGSDLFIDGSDKCGEGVRFGSGIGSGIGSGSGIGYSDGFEDGGVVGYGDGGGAVFSGMESFYESNLYQGERV